MRRRDGASRRRGGERDEGGKWGERRGKEEGCTPVIRRVLKQTAPRSLFFCLPKRSALQDRLQSLSGATCYQRGPTHSSGTSLERERERESVCARAYFGVFLRLCVWVSVCVCVRAP